MKGRLFLVGSVPVMLMAAVLMLATPASAGKPAPPPPGPLQVAGCYNYTATVTRNTCPTTVPSPDTGMMQVNQAGTNLTLTSDEGLMNGSTTLNSDGSISLKGTMTGDPCPSGATCTYTAGGKFAERKGVMGFSGTGKVAVTEYILGIPITCSISASTVAIRTSTDSCTFPAPPPSVP